MCILQAIFGNLMEIDSNGLQEKVKKSEKFADVINGCSLAANSRVVGRTEMGREREARRPNAN